MPARTGPSPASAVAPAPGHPTGPIPWSSWRLAMVIAFGAFMSQLDTSVVNVGLDTITRDLDAHLHDAQWVANGYLIALGLSLPAGGWLGRRFGVGRVWLASLAGFTLASGLCGLAGSLGWLITARVLQGLTAGLLVPAGQTVLGQEVGPRRLGRVMASLGIAVALAPALGPVLGGLLLRVASWPWLFLVNLPLGALGLGLGWRYVPHRRPDSHPGRLDWRGLLLVAAGAPLLVYGLTSWGELGRPDPVAVAAPACAGLLGLAAFGWYAPRTVAPVLDLRLFANPAYAAATVTAAVNGAAMFGGMLLLPLYFQLARGADAFGAGLVLIWHGLGTALALPVTGRLVDRVGGGPVCLCGAAALVLTTVPLALLHPDTDILAVQGLLLLRGMAIGVAVVPAGIAAYQAVTPRQLPDATTQVNILQRVGGALGGAVFTVVLSGRLAGGAEAAFRTAFWLLAATSLLGVAGAAWLAAAQRRRAGAGGSGP